MKLRCIAMVMALLAGCTRCQRVGAVGGAAIAGLGVMGGAYIADSSLNLPRKCGGDNYPTGGCFHNGGEPLHQVFDHHVTSTNNLMLIAGIPGVMIGAIIGAWVAHNYCGSPDEPTPWSELANWLNP